MKKYGYTKETHMSFNDTIEKVTQTLAEQGFGILNQINIKDKIKEKLNKDHDEYIVLGACNPGLAYEALQSEIEIGLLLPCNVIVYNKESKTYVSCIVPSVAMGIVENERVFEIAKIAEEKLKRAIDNV